MFERAVELYGEVGYRNGELFALNALATASTPAQARPLFKQAIGIAREIDDSTGLAAATINLALVDVGEGQVQSARRSLDEALAISRRAGDHDNEASAQANRCQVLHRAGDAAAAIDACLDADALWSSTGEAGQARVNLDFATALVHIDQAQLVDAEAAARRGLERARALRSPVLEASGESTLAEVLRRRGRLADAVLAVERARVLWKQAPEPADPEIRVAIEIEAGRVAVAMPTREQARTALVQAMNDARAGDWVQDLRDARLALGELDWRAGRRVPARADLNALADEARAPGDLHIVHEVESILRR
jgi:tetratricopeptide (TPR) repeat protein